MWNYPDRFDVIVVGGGHAGCEAAHIAAKMGLSTLLLTMNLDTIGKMSCNPAIGGTAKGHMVREIDALGGIMGKIADKTGIQFRMLNASKGPAVRSPRAQSDKLAYQNEMKSSLELIDSLFIKQGTIESLWVENDQIKGVHTKEGITYLGKAVILSSGTFMRGLLHIGTTQIQGGRSGDAPSLGLSGSLESLGFKLERLKTGTPPRIDRKSIDFSQLEEQKGDEGVRFSFEKIEPILPQVSCYITYTSKETKEIVEKNLHLSPLYSGVIQSKGPRYCPSIEDKMVRFADKERHQIFLEPEGVTTQEFYVNGISTSLPPEVQLQMIRSVPGLEKAEITRPAYAIEYDYLCSGQVGVTLESKQIEGLYFTGQINGTTGYEEAASQGLIAGINAAAKIKGLPPFILNRKQAYIGVMIDDLITKDLDEPYRMFTSRAEYRLFLRQDNADLRLYPYGEIYGTLSKERCEKTREKEKTIENEIERLKKTFCSFEKKNLSLAQLLCRPELSYPSLLELFPDKMKELQSEIHEQVETSVKYEGYMERQSKEAEKMSRLDEILLPKGFNFIEVVGLRQEAKEKLTRFSPPNLGIASRISGVSFADISVLMVCLQKR